MSIKGRYKQFGQLKDLVIETVINEVDESTNYKNTAEYHKRSRGKVYDGLMLKLHKKTLDKLTMKIATCHKLQ